MYNFKILDIYPENTKIGRFIINRRLSLKFKCDAFQLYDTDTDIVSFLILHGFTQSDTT